MLDIQRKLVKFLELFVRENRILKKCCPGLNYFSLKKVCLGKNVWELSVFDWELKIAEFDIFVLQNRKIF